MTIDEKRNIQSNIGTACRIHRERVGMTLTELANLFEIDYNMLSRFENGESGQVYILVLYVLIGFNLTQFLNAVKEEEKTNPQPKRQYGNASYTEE